MKLYKINKIYILKCVKNETTNTRHINNFRRKG